MIVRISPSGLPLSLAIASGPAVIGLGTLGGLDPAGQVLLMLLGCLLATAAVLRLSPRSDLTPACWTPADRARPYTGIEWLRRPTDSAHGAHGSALS